MPKTDSRDGASALRALVDIMTSAGVGSTLEFVTFEGMANLLDCIATTVEEDIADLRKGREEVAS